MVAALVRMQANTLSDAASKNALDAIQGRILAIAGVHRRLYTSEDVRTVEIAGYLESLLGDLEVTMRSSGSASILRLKAEPVHVATDKAVSIGVIVTELVTNAFKYAYADGADGEIRVFFGRASDDKIQLAVEDDGVGWNGAAAPEGYGRWNPHRHGDRAQSGLHRRLRWNQRMPGQPRVQNLSAAAVRIGPHAIEAASPTISLNKAESPTRAT